VRITDETTMILEDGKKSMISFIFIISFTCITSTTPVEKSERVRMMDAESVRDDIGEMKTTGENKSMTLEI